MYTKPDPIHEQLTAARRAQILEAATRVFALKGFARATIKEIAREAGVADGTIYLYFENKEALMMALFDMLNESEARDFQFAQAAEMELADFFKMFTRHRAAELRQGPPDMFRVLLGELLINGDLRARYYNEITVPTMAIARRYFEQWIAQGRIRNYDPALLTSAVAGLFLGLFLLQELGDELLAQHEEELPGFITEFLLHGLLPEPPNDDPEHNHPDHPDR